MSAARHDSAGRRALAEAARLETALVYGRTRPEPRSDPKPPPVSVFAALAEAELEAALERQRQAGEDVDEDVNFSDAPVDIDDEPEDAATEPDPPNPQPAVRGVHSLLAAAMCSEMTNHQAMTEYGVSYAVVHAARAAS